MVLHTIKNKMKRRMPDALWMRLRYHYHRLLYSCAFFDIKFVLKRLFNRRRYKSILFYPDEPQPYHEIYKLYRLLGYKKVNALDADYDAAFNWQDTTFKSPDPDLTRLAGRMNVVNIRCMDNSKTKVDRIFKEVFGYSAAIDPLIYKGECFKKSDLNAKDAEAVLRCPVKEAEEGFVYQRLLKATSAEGLLLDISVPFLNEYIL